MMLGREHSFALEKPDATTGAPLLEVESAQALGDRDLPALKGVSLTVHAGEIVGVAGEGPAEEEAVPVQDYPGVEGEVDFPDAKKSFTLAEQPTTGKGSRASRRKESTYGFPDFPRGCHHRSALPLQPSSLSSTPNQP
ncbi:MAG: hypothetical protein ACE5JS_03415 [Nitrospinota bacterium]